jgi:hypothetical protein
MVQARWIWRYMHCSIVHGPTLINGMEKVAASGSGGQRGYPAELRCTPPTPCDLFQFPFDGPCAGKATAVHFVERIIGRIEHEAAWNADCNADRLSVELDDKSLADH